MVYWIRAFLRLAIWYRSDRRPILNSYLPPHGSKDARNDMLIKLDLQPSLDAKAVVLAELMKDARDLDTVFAFLKANKTDEYLLDPRKLFGQSDIREVLHILRPLLYGKNAQMNMLIAALFLATKDSKSKLVRWSPWAASLLIDGADMARDFYDMLTKEQLRFSCSPLESEERETRLSQLLNYYFREPFYSQVTSKVFDSIDSAIGDRWWTRPATSLARGYRSLLEGFYFYTSAS